MSEPAFPSKQPLGNGETHHHMGMSLRDYFAGQALPAVIAGFYANLACGAMNVTKGAPPSEIYAPVAVDAYAIADVMLEARK